MTPRTIGPDKVNQLRHVRFLKDNAGITALMDRHRALIAPKFEKVLEIFSEKLSGLPGVSWTEPKGGYFISLDVPPGCAKRVVALAKEAGVELTPAGATHPLGNDPEDRTIRIAPTFPELTRSGTRRRRRRRLRPAGHRRARLRTVSLTSVQRRWM